MNRGWWMSSLAGVCLLGGAGLQAQVSLKQSLFDEVVPHWIYDDFDKAVQEAKATGKPILALIRCVP